MSKTLEIHEPVMSYVTKAQESVLSFLGDAATRVAEQLPSVPVGPADEFLARGAELADGGLALAEDLLARNRAFVSDLFGVATTLVEGLGQDETATPAPAKKAAPKAA